MKAIIHETLYLKDYGLFNGFEAIQKFLNYYHIFNKIQTDGKNEWIEIEPQKITLDEKAMNELFDEVFHAFDIEYAGLGGAGCDFSIIVKNPKK